MQKQQRTLIVIWTDPTIPKETKISTFIQYEIFNILQDSYRLFENDQQALNFIQGNQKSDIILICSDSSQILQQIVSLRHIGLHVYTVIVLGENQCFRDEIRNNKELKNTIKTLYFFANEQQLFGSFLQQIVEKWNYVQIIVMRYLDNLQAMGLSKQQEEQQKTILYYYLKIAISSKSIKLPSSTMRESKKSGKGKISQLTTEMTEEWEKQKQCQKQFLFNYLASFMGIHYWNPPISSYHIIYHPQNICMFHAYIQAIKGNQNKDNDHQYHNKPVHNSYAKDSIEKQPISATKVLQKIIELADEVYLSKLKKDFQQKKQQNKLNPQDPIDFMLAFVYLYTGLAVFRKLNQLMRERDQSFNLYSKQITDTVSKGWAMFISKKQGVKYYNGSTVYRGITQEDKAKPGQFWTSAQFLSCSSDIEKAGGFTSPGGTLYFIKLSEEKNYNYIIMDEIDQKFVFSSIQKEILLFPGIAFKVVQSNQKQEDKELRYLNLEQYSEVNYQKMEQKYQIKKEKIQKQQNKSEQNIQKHIQIIYCEDLYRKKENKWIYVGPFKNRLKRP